NSAARRSWSAARGSCSRAEVAASQIHFCDPLSRLDGITDRHAERVEGPVGPPGEASRREGARLERARAEVTLWKHLWRPVGNVQRPRWRSPCAGGNATFRTWHRPGNRIVVHVWNVQRTSPRSHVQRTTARSKRATTRVGVNYAGNGSYPPQRLAT